jgi:phosphoglucosamine mutase
MVGKKFFGTDGIRGTANKGLMTAETALKLGMAVGTLFKRGDHRHLVIIGKDTRLSGYLLEPALTSGLISVGMDVLLVGPMPTPAIAMLTKSLRADIGIMLSASHNPYYDNGIKIFGPEGLKLSDKTELVIEDLMSNYPKSVDFAKPRDLGRARRLDDAPGRYVEYVKNSFPKGKKLSDFKLVVDSSNGSAYHIAGKIFWELGAEVINIGDKPDGFNINENCGSQHPQAAINAVLEHKADLGIVLDGDADRLVIIDNKGKVINGDQILAVIATHMHKHNLLINDTVVSTHMANIGLENYLRSKGIDLVRTDVGDRYVAEVMHNSGYNLGGEQSGHIILSDYSTTGDGIIAALSCLDCVIENQAQKSVAEFFNCFIPVPQVIHNIKYDSQIANILEQDRLIAKINEAKTKLKDGRLIVRKSGTEPIIRIMVESTEPDLINIIISELESEIKQVI